MLPTRTHDVIVEYVPHHQAAEYEAAGWVIEPAPGNHALYRVMASKRVPKSKGERR